MSRKKMNRQLTRKGKLLGGYVPAAICSAIEVWVSKDPERDLSTFVRQAAREKLVRDGIPFNEKATEEVAA